MSEREQFEAWFSDGGKYPHAVERSGEGYVFAAANSQWEAWQASREALKAEQGQGSELLASAKIIEQSAVAIVQSLKQPAVDGWIACADRMPEEGGRYWCYVEEQNSLGKSHYQWNCSWNGDEWGGEALSGRVTHWQPLPSPPAINHPIDTTPNQYDALGKGGEQ